MFIKALTDFKIRHPGLFPEKGKELYLRLRGLNAKSRALPDFLIVGAQKSGSTSLFSYLSLHPQVVPSVQKEIFYFNKFYQAGPAWYRRYFPKVAQLGADCITGEASSTYLCSEEAPSRARQLVPQAKIIVILREPAARAISHYHHRVYMMREHRPLEEVFSPAIIQAWTRGEAVPDSSGLYFERGLYAKHLSGWLDHFPRQQVLVLKAEAMFADRNHILGQVYDFLGIRPMTLSDDKIYKKGKTRDTIREANVLEQMRDAYQPANEVLYQMPIVPFRWR